MEKINLLNTDLKKLERQIKQETDKREFHRDLISEMIEVEKENIDNIKQGKYKTIHLDGVPATKQDINDYIEHKTKRIEHLKTLLEEIDTDFNYSRNRLREVKHEKEKLAGGTITDKERRKLIDKQMIQEWKNDNNFNRKKTAEMYVRKYFIDDDETTIKQETEKARIRLQKNIARRKRKP